MRIISPIGNLRRLPGIILFPAMSFIMTIAALISTFLRKRKDPVTY